MIKIDKLFGDKKGNTAIYILLAVGIMLLIFGNGIKKEPQTAQTVAQYSNRTLQAERILSEIKGAGKVSVMISEGKEKEESLLITDKKEKNASSDSVLIVAEGGSDSAVCEKLVRAAAAALGVSPHKIEVFERKE